MKSRWPQWSNRTSRISFVSFVVFVSMMLALPHLARASVTGDPSEFNLCPIDFTPPDGDTLVCSHSETTGGQLTIGNPSTSISNNPDSVDLGAYSTSGLGIFAVEVIVTPTNGQINGLGGTASASTLCSPEGIAVDGSGNLYIADTDNQCVLEYANPFAACGNTFPNVGGAAKLVLGQGNSFTSNACDFDTGGGFFDPASAIDLCYPTGVAVDGGGNLYIADSSNRRVVEYNFPLSTGAAASVVFGQGGSRRASSTLAVLSIRPVRSACAIRRALRWTDWATSYKQTAGAGVQHSADHRHDRRLGLWDVRQFHDECMHRD